MKKRDEATLNARARMTPEERDAELLDALKILSAKVAIAAEEGHPASIYWDEMVFAKSAIERATNSAIVSLRCQHEPRVTQAMLDSQLDTARILDELDKRSEARAALLSAINARASMAPEERDAEIAREIFGPGFYSLFGAVKAPDAVESEEGKIDER